jgi:succinylglutamate desuccinylase
MAYPQMQLSASQLQIQLQKIGDFLHLTRSHENSMVAINFEVECKKSSSRAKVSVVDTGMIFFEPLNHLSCKDIVLSSGVHGNETAPIEICNELIKSLILGELHLENRTLFLFGNPPSINIGCRFVEENLNRLFSDSHTQSSLLGKKKEQRTSNKERCRALLLEKTVKSFYESKIFKEAKSERFHYDLHTAIRGSKNDKFAVYPFRDNKPWVKEQLQFMLACGIDTILFSNSPTTTFSYFSSNEFGAHAFTVELGKVKPFGENDMTKFVDVTVSLTRLISGKSLELADYKKQDFNFFEINQVINRHSDFFTFNFSDDVENFADFAIGTVIAIDGKQKIKTQNSGEAIIFPNADVAIGQRALLTVIPVEINPE